MTESGVKYELELASFCANIALAKLEESKAAVRTRELEYGMVQFQQQVMLMQAQEFDKQEVLRKSNNEVYDILKRRGLSDDLCKKATALGDKELLSGYGISRTPLVVEVSNAI
jgi:hypothetical protein